MFGRRYWGARYFGPRDWGAGGSAAPTPSYPGLVEALAAFLAADATIIEAFPGGWANGDQCRDAEFPYGTFVKAKTRRLNVLGFRSVETVTIHFYAVAVGADGAEAAARTLRARLLPTADYTPAALSFADGTEVSGPAGRFIPADDGGETTLLDPTRGPLNTDVFHSVLPVCFRVARG